MRSAIWKWAFILELLLRLPALAQPAGPELGSRQFELGINIDRYHRNIRPRINMEVSYGLIDIFIGYGVNRYVSISAEGFAVKWNSCACDMPRQYRTYILGAGVTARLLRINNYRLAAVVRYVERFDFDRSAHWEHHNQSDIDVSMQIERSFILRGNAGDLWLGSGYFSDQITYFEYDWIRADKQSSYRNFGVTAGADILLFHHIKPYLYTVYADYLQPRFGLGYLF